LKRDWHCAGIGLWSGLARFFRSFLCGTGTAIQPWHGSHTGADRGRGKYFSSGNIAG
jgi:hypothetical protein